MTNSKRYVRFKHISDPNNQVPRYGELDNEDILVLKDNIFENPEFTGEKLKLSNVKLLAPVTPHSIFCVGRNYRSHAGDKATSIPGIFTKLPTTIVGPGDPIPYPKGAENLHHEGEMVIVIGKKCININAENAPDFVFGITCGNDMSERNWQKSDLQWVRAKASDGFGPIGPYLVTGLDYNDLLLETRLNGETVQSERTSQLIHDVGNIISFISQTITLHPGDIIFTGTPGQTNAVTPGDKIEVDLEGVGVLKNEVVKIQQ
ncbi:MAG: fumarylacetoacetate hydrolase family protein [Pseudomonadota bacterium]